MAYTKAHQSTRSEALRGAQQRYRQNKREQLNEKSRQKYDPLKRRQAYDPVKRHDAYINTPQRGENEAFKALKTLFQ